VSDAPWQQKKWTSGPLKDANRHAGCLLLAVALFWNGISWAVAVPTVLEPNAGGARLFVLLFPLVGVGLAAAAVHAILRRRRYGAASFELATLPGVIGRVIAGQVLVERGLEAESDVQLTLKCVRKVVTGSGKQRKTTETKLWEATQQLPGTVADRGMIRIPVAFAIPPEAEPTDERNSRDTIQWELEARSAREGVDFYAKFEVPVFRTAESAAPLTAEERRQLGA
jgi:hypothetical protein